MRAEGILVKAVKDSLVITTVDLGFDESELTLMPQAHFTNMD